MSSDKIAEIRKILTQQQDESAVQGVVDQAELSPQNPSEADISQYEALLAQMQEQKDEFLRQAAEYENSRKRLAKDKEDSVKYANEKLLNDIFPVLDSLEMTLSHVKPEQSSDPLVAGVQLILKQLLQTLQKHGVEELGLIGDVFDPHQHEAIGAAPTPDFKPGLVAQVHRKGYKLKDRLIRAALVTVSQ